MEGGRLPVRPELGTEKPSVPTYLTGDFLMARSGLYPIKIISKDPGDTEAGIKQPWLWFQSQVPRSVKDSLPWPRKNSREATHSEYKWAPPSLLCRHR